MSIHALGAMVPRWRFFASCICSEPRAAHFRPAFWIRTKPTPCVEVWQTSNLRPLKLGEEIKEEEEITWKYIWSALLHRATIKKTLERCNPRPHVANHHISDQLLSLWRHSQYDVSGARGARSHRSHYDVILNVTSFATELATPTVMDVRTYVRYGHLTAFNI